MPIMNWDKSLDTGVAAMNDEHCKILDAMNRIYDLHEAGQSGAAINGQVALLGDICVRHFASEERFMEKIGFPTLDNHKRIHAKLLQDYGQHAEKIKAEGGKANVEFFRFLRYWLTAHIKGIDVKYGEHVNRAAA